MNLPAPNPESRLVQVHATASHWQAEAACQRLLEEGIPAQVTGQHLGPAVRTWQNAQSQHGVLVLETQAQQAFELLTEWLESGQPKREPETRPAPPREEWDVPSEEDTHKEPRTTVLVGTWLSKLMGVAGVCVLALACWTAWINARQLDRFSGEATARVADLEKQRELVEEFKHAPYGQQIPTQYIYEVEGTKYRFSRMTGLEYPHEIAVRYNPGDPASLGPETIAPPLWCLFLGGLVGGFLLLGSWQFHRTQA